MKRLYYVHCRDCGKEFSLAIDPADYFDWTHGKLAQRAFPYLTADERELLISGICGACFDKIFK